MRELQKDAVADAVLKSEDDHKYWRRIQLNRFLDDIKFQQTELLRKQEALLHEVERNKFRYNALQEENEWITSRLSVLDAEVTEGFKPTLTASKLDDLLGL